MHQISILKIQNFRACKEVYINLESYTPLVGQNNSGKSTILEAIRLVLKPSALIAGDFADSKKPIIVTACITGITPDIIKLIPEAKHQKAISPYCATGTLWIRVIADKPGAKNITKEIYDHESYSGSGLPGETAWRSYPTGLPQAVSALLPESIFVEAMDDIGEDLGKAKAGTTIKNLLEEIMGPMLKAHADLNLAIDTIRNILTTDGTNRSTHLKDFDTNATKTLGQFFPGLSIDLDLQIIDIKEFFKAGDLHVTDNITSDRRRFDQMGTGAQRAIQMALIRYLAQIRTTTEKHPARRLLLIDEPELYLHPQGVSRLRQALLNLSQSGFQVIFSTHSPLMLSRDNAADTVIVEKSSVAGVVPKKPLRIAVQEALSDAPAQSRTLFELGNLAEIYFSDRVVLCEGKTDLRLLPLAYERIYGNPMELDQTAVVALGSCSDIPKALKVLAAMEIKACAIADLDFAFTTARKGSPPFLPKEGLDIKQSKDVLKRIQPTHGFPIANNDLPQNKNGWKAADTWALFAKEPDGKKLSLGIQAELQNYNVWIWSEGCIEHVTGTTEKGEDAIFAQEEQLKLMSATDIETQMPGFKSCFEWIRGL